MHEVERAELRIGGDEGRWNDGEVFGDVVGDAEGGERAARHQHLFADLHHFDQLGRVGVEIHHIAGLLGGLGAAVHGHGHIGLGQRRGVVGAIARHGHEPTLGLGLADERELVLRRGLGEEVVHPGLGGDGRCGEPVVAGDHHRADAHAAQLREALLDAALDDVLELHDAEHTGRRPGFERRALGHDQGRAAAPRHRFDMPHDRLGPSAVGLKYPVLERVGRALADEAARQVHPAHTGLGREGDEASGRIGGGLMGRALLSRQGHDAAAFGCLVGQRGQARGVGQFSYAHAGRWQERAGLTVAEGDGAGLVQQQHVDIARRFDGAARSGHDIGQQHAPHAGHADGRQQTADGGRDEADQQCDQHRESDRNTRVIGVHRVDGKRQQRHRHQQEHQGQRHQQNGQRDLVGRLAPLGAFDQADHAVEEGLAGIGRAAHHDPVRQHLGASGHGGEVAAGLADHRGRLAGDGALIHRGHAFDHLAIAGQQITGFHEHHIATAQTLAGHLGPRGAGARFG